MDDEKLEQIVFEHLLHKKRIVFDKIVLGSLVVILGLLAGITLEKYKSSNTAKVFLLESKLDAIRAIRISYTESAAVLYDVACEEKFRTDENLLLLGKKIHSLASVINTQSILVSPEFHNVYKRIIYIHAGAAQSSSSLTCDYSDFFSAVGQNLIYETRVELGLSTRGIVKGFKPDQMKLAKMYEMGATRYVESNYQKWKSQ